MVKHSIPAYQPFIGLIDAAFWYLPKFIFRRSTVNIISFDSIFWINLPMLIGF
jgi:hypothetical protein